MKNIKMKKVKLSLNIFWNESYIEECLLNQTEFKIKLHLSEKNVFNVYTTKKELFIESNNYIFKEKFRKSAIDKLKEFILDKFRYRNIDINFVNDESLKKSKIKIKLNFKKEKLEKLFQDKKDFYILFPIVSAELESDISIYFKNKDIFIQHDDETVKINNIKDIISYIKSF